MTHDNFTETMSSTTGTDQSTHLSIPIPEKRPMDTLQIPVHSSGLPDAEVPKKGLIPTISISPPERELTYDSMTALLDQLRANIGIDNRPSECMLNICATLDEIKADLLSIKKKSNAILGRLPENTTIQTASPSHGSNRRRK